MPRNVWTLGWVAFFNDTATEMSYWLLPQFLTSVLGAGPMAFGFIEGAAETVASFTRLLSGLVSDRWRRRKPIAAAGYTVANLAKPLLALAQSWPQVFWIRFADRGSKGLRAAPRDALIADSAHPSQRGAAFGLLQAMDTAGAILGPLSALLCVQAFHGNVRAVFWVAAIPGAMTVLLAWAAVREVRPAKDESGNSKTETGKSKVENRNWKMEPRLKWMLLAVGVFSLGNSSDLFLILRSQNLGLRPSLAPALGLAFNAVYSALSWPAGKLSDCIPRRGLVAGGYAIYALVYFGFARATSPLAAWVLFPAYGLYYALSEGVLKAWIADLAPSTRRASMYGLFNWVVGVAALPASVLAGWLWRHYNPAAPFYVSAALAALAALLLLKA
ncbi:MAG TPA: MFS transporter [Terriglobia bacterium]|nr:MFS transporter [Terriglobia bacterium]